jgi:hypothetical protein
LRRRGVLSFGDGLDKVDEREVRLSRLGVGEAGNRVAEIAFAELGGRVDRAGKESLAEWTERDEADAELLERGKDRLFRLAPQSEYSLCNAVRG